MAEIEDKTQDALDAGETGIVIVGAPAPPVTMPEIDFETRLANAAQIVAPADPAYHLVPGLDRTVRHRDESTLRRRTGDCQVCEISSAPIPGLRRV